jgi:hypothetical protein
MTPEQLRTKLEQRRLLNEQLEALIADEEQLAALSTWTEGAEIRQITVTVNPPTGERLVAVMTDSAARTTRYSTNSEGAHLLATMLISAMQQAQSDIEARKANILAQL